MKFELKYKKDYNSPKITTEIIDKENFKSLKYYLGKKQFSGEFEILNYETNEVVFYDPNKNLKEDIIKFVEKEGLEYTLAEYDEGGFLGIDDRLLVLAIQKYVQNLK